MQGSMSMSKRASIATGALSGGYINTSSEVDRSVSAKVSSKNIAHNPPPLTHYENTYRLEPENQFPCSKVNQVITDVLERNLRDITYDRDVCGRLSRSLADEIREKAKSVLETRRFKVVTFVVIGEKGNATVALASRCVWNDKVDTRAEATYSNKHVYAVGVAYGMYHE